MDLPPSSSSSSSPPDLSEPIEANNDDDAIKNWTKLEKVHLIEALKLYGRHDIEKIQENVCTKNLEETKAALDYFTGIALQQPVFKKQKNPQPPKPEPLDQWAKLLKENHDSEELATGTSTAIRMIADLENIPPPEVTEGIDFRQVYHQIANAMEGKPMTADAGTIAVLQMCLKETAKKAKDFIKPAELKSLINNLDLKDKTQAFPLPTENPEDHELSILRHLASQLNYNPLKIPEEFLMGSAAKSSTSYFPTASTSKFAKPSTSKTATPSTSQATTPSTSEAATSSSSYAATQSTSNTATPLTSNAATQLTTDDDIHTGVPFPGSRRQSKKGKKGESKGKGKKRGRH